MSEPSDTRNFLIGAFIGTLSILPGTSGGVAAVVFGVYERLVRNIADIFNKIKTDFRFLATIGLGILAGVLLTAFGTRWFMSNFEVIAMFLFTGLIIGQFPDVYGMTKVDRKKKTSFLHYLAFAVGVFLTLLLLSTEDFGGISLEISGNLTSCLLLVLTGIVIAAAVITPGISGSSLLLVMGLYYPILTAITEFDILVILVFGLGLVIGGIGFAKLISWALSNYYKSTFFMILGLTVGSTLIVGYKAVSMTGGLAEGLLGALALTAGFAISIWLSKINRRYSTS
ncbi:MAG: DUF368 domain-containing protein [Candidatus Methanomethylophilaceae archaeon]